MKKLILIFYSFALSIIPGIITASIVVGRLLGPIKPGEEIGAFAALALVPLVSCLTILIYSLLFFILLSKTNSKRYFAGLSMTTWLVITILFIYLSAAIWVIYGYDGYAGYTAWMSHFSGNPD